MKVSLAKVTLLEQKQIITAIKILLEKKYKNIWCDVVLSTQITSTKT